MIGNAPIWHEFRVRAFASDLTGASRAGRTKRDMAFFGLIQSCRSCKRKNRETNARSVALITWIGRLFAKIPLDMVVQVGWKILTTRAPLGSAQSRGGIGKPTARSRIDPAIDSRELNDSRSRSGNVAVLLEVAKFKIPNSRQNHSVIGTPELTPFAIV